MVEEMGWLLYGYGGRWLHSMVTGRQMVLVQVCRGENKVMSVLT